MEKKRLKPLIIISFFFNKIQSFFDIVNFIFTSRSKNYIIVIFYILDYSSLNYQLTLVKLIRKIPYRK